MILAGMLGGWEIVLTVAVVIILFGAKKLPPLARGMSDGLQEFRRASREVTDEIRRSAGIETDEERVERDRENYLMWITLVLGSVALMLVMYEYAK
jgi:sec-independent protein translocase protein TatA